LKCSDVKLKTSNDILCISSDKNKISNPFKEGDTVWHKLERTKPTENQKLSSKFDEPWKITKLVESTHNFNVNLVHVNNSNATRRTSIRKLKRAFLRPEQLLYIKENRPQDQSTPL